MTTATTAHAFAAVRRLSFAVLEARHQRPLRDVRNELFAVFGVDQVHVARIAQDATSGRGNGLPPGHRREPKPDPEYIIPFDGPSAVRDVARAASQ